MAETFSRLELDELAHKTMQQSWKLWHARREVVEHKQVAWQKHFEQDLPFAALLTTQSYWRDKVIASQDKTRKILSNDTFS